ncbi:MAG: DUF4062 domain-containing protein [Desulfuromonadales bacterium]|nr:DUF4062 domain-containing protein [Desulfuromonadales bacterium]
MTARKQLFISSVQKELADERRALKEYVHGDPLLRRFFEVFLFEDLPASDRRADAVYLHEVEQSAIYVGLFGNVYGYEDAEGISPTEREFDHATTCGTERLIFVKGNDDSARHPKMLALIRKVGDQLIRRRYGSIPELTAILYASLIEHLERSGDIRSLPFDASACPRATFDDLSEEKLADFLGLAQRGRGYPLASDTPMLKALTHLNLLENGNPTHAAILLFGNFPQRFLISSEVKCMHFHGTEIRKPIPSYQIYKGTVFELVDQAVDFVMSKLAARVGTRSEGPQAPVTYEIPRDVVAEAIVNAVAHRNYTSNASVQVMLFSDRLEIWNPGQLPPPLTLAALRKPHPSIPHNPLIAEPLFLARYIERAGTGTLDMIALCSEVKIPTPEFKQEVGTFMQIIRRPEAQPESEPQSNAEVTGQVGTKLALSRHQVEILRKCEEESAITDLMDIAERSDRTKFRHQVLAPLLEDGLLEMTIPHKPTSSKQKYRLTANGAEILKHTK